ncbi:MAG: hypothetical protein QOD92_2636 [Acidimicrobiaceae bacterium]
MITRTQALEAGLHRRAIDRLIAGGRWEIVARGVYRVLGSPRSWEQRALGLVLAAGDDAVVSHRSAAHVYGLDGFGPPGRIEITTARHRRHSIVGATVHESLDPHLLGTRLRHGIPVTGPARTILDVCWVADDDLTALGALDEMLRRRLVTWAKLWECLVVHARRGRNGVARFRRILLKRWGKRGPRGVFVRTVQSLLDDAGLPEPIAEHGVKLSNANYRLDLAYPDAMVAIELDDKESHLTDKAFEEDPVRENRLKLAGWLVLRYTWDRLINEPNVIVDEVREALRVRSCAA